MNSITRYLACMAVLALPFAQPSSAADAPVNHRLLFTEYGKGPNRFVELDGDGKLVWEFSDKDAPDLNITWISSLQQLGE